MTKIPTRKRRWPTMGLAGLVVAMTATLLGATPAGAAPVTFNYDITGGEAYVQKLDSTVTLGTGTLAADIDLATGAFSAMIDLETAHGDFRVLGFPVSADLDLEQTVPATGTIKQGAISATAEVVMRLSNVRFAHVPVFVGNNCRTMPATIPLKSAPGFNPLVGGDLVTDPVFTLPRFTGCKLITVFPYVTDLALDTFISGPDNTFQITTKWAN